MNEQEMKAMEGVEFTYVFEDGDEIRAYVKKVDPKVGMTCVTLDTVTKNNWVPDRKYHGLEKDGTFCVCAIDFSYRNHTLKDIVSLLTKIKETGRMTASTVGVFSYGEPTCAFT